MEQQLISRLKLNRFLKVLKLLKLLNRHKTKQFQDVFQNKSY